MQLVAQLDPQRLEALLLQRIEQAQPPGSCLRVLVLVPSTRLADHVERRLGQRRAAWLGIEVLHLRSAAQRSLELHGPGAPRVVSSRLLDALLARLLARLADNAWARAVADRPGTLPRLRDALNELREAGIEPRALERAGADDPWVRALAAIYQAYARALREMGRTGRVDDAGLIEAALPCAAPFARGFAAIFVHGAYEWIGLHLDFLRALDVVRPVTLLLPCAPGSSVSRFAEQFATSRQLGTLAHAQEEAEQDGATGRAGLSLAALYDETSRPPAAADRFEFRHAQGAVAEVRLALREALEAVRCGCPPEEIVIAARSLEPYAAALEQAFEEVDVPWNTSLGSPLRRQPIVRDFLLLLELLERDFPRESTAELLRSRRVRWSALLAQGSFDHGDQAEPWSRAARLLGGIDEWTGDLPRWAAQPQYREARLDEERAEEFARRRVEIARRIADAVLALQGLAWNSASSWSDHADRLEALLRLAISTDDDPQAQRAHDELLRLFGEMRELDRLPDPPARIAFGEMRRWLESSVDDSSLRLRPVDAGGVRVLDAMELRGSTCRRLFLLGMNSGLFPAGGSEDPILRDPTREQLRRATGRALPLKGGRVDEERLLLALTLGSAAERVHLSWQRSDEAGRGKTPSLALREVARLALGDPDMRAIVGTRSHFPSHPTHALEALVERPGLLSPEERLLYDMLRQKSSEALPASARRHAGLRHGLELLRATQSFRLGDVPGVAAYDGRIGPRRAAGRFSVSALETLGRCPLQYFFSRVLGVRELDAAASLFEIPPREAGTYLHAVLERLYRRLFLDERLGSGDAARLVARALELLDEERAGILGDYGERLRRRLPVLFRHLCETWIDRLKQFVSRDLRWIVEQRWEPVGFEEQIEARLELSADRSIVVRGRLDRRMVRDGEQRVGDYKNSKHPEQQVKRLDALRANVLQAPLYQALLDGQAGVEILHIGAGFDPEEYRFTFDGFDAAQAAGFRETLRVLSDLEHRGVFPLRPEPQRCKHCAYTAACRRTHPPTLERDAQYDDTAEFRRLPQKNEKRPLLADLDREEGGA